MTHIDIRYSRDGGHNWIDWRKIPLGEVGDFVRDIQVRRLGMARQFVFDIRVTDPVKADIMAASIMVEATES